MPSKLRRASLVSGILSLCLFWVTLPATILGLAAIILGLLHYRKTKAYAPAGILAGVWGAALSLTLFVLTVTILFSSAFAIWVNWRINVLGYPQIYYQDTRKPEGEGEFRYTVIQFESFDDVSFSADWQTGPDSDVESFVNGALQNHLSAPKTMEPDFTVSYMAYSGTNAKGDRIDLVYSLRTNTLYAVENFH